MIVEGVKRHELDPDRRGYLEEWFALAQGIHEAMRQSGRILPEVPSFETYCAMRKERTWGRFAKGRWPGLESTWTPKGEGNASLGS